jgi:hypothetical protein
VDSWHWCQHLSKDNVFLYLSIWAMIVLWTLKVQRWNVVKAENTTLVIWSLPTWDRKVDILESLLSHFVMSGRKSTTFGLVVPKGKPK